jgi:DNA replication protein DnaC
MKTLRATEYIDLVTQGEYAHAKRHLSQTPCPKCINNLGFVTTIDPQGRSIARRCRCQGIDHRIKMFNQAQVPARYLDAELVSYHPRDLTGVDALHRMRQFAWSFLPQRRGLIIYGGYGTGKTYLAVSILKVLTLLRGYHVRFVEFSHLLSQLQAEFGRTDRSRHTHNIFERGGVMRQLINAECLIIDELGEGRQSDWARSVLEELITKRYNASGTTIITTNYDPRRSQLGEPEHLEERIGARLYSRLQQMCDPIPLFGGDYRERRS